MNHPPVRTPANSPRRRVVRNSALAAGFLVIFVTAVVVFSSEIADLTDEWLTEANGGEIAEETTVDSTELVDPTPQPETDTSRHYVEGDVGFPRTLNPLLAETMSEETVATMLYRHLLSTSESGDPEPDLATSWTVSDDGLIHTVELDAGATWHDGESLGVDDVLFTIALVKDPEFPGDSNLSRFWRAITPRQTGDHTLEFKLLEPYVGFGSYLKLPVLPKHIYGNVLPGDLPEIEFESGHVGSGAYRLDDVDRDAGELRFARTNTDDQMGYSELVLRYFGTRDEVLQAFRDGDLDGISYLPMSALDDDSALPEGARVYAPELSGYTALFFNIRHPHFRDVRTRQAIEAAIDRESLVDSVLGGHASPGTSPIPSMFSAHAPGDHRDHDIDQARQLLEEAGWFVEDGEDIRQRDGEYFIVPLIVNSDDPQRVAVATELQEQLYQVGISVDVQALPSADVQRSLDTRQFTAALFGWRTENGNLDCFQMWHSSQSEEGTNFTGFAHSEADELLFSARRAITIEERNAHYAGFQEIFAEQVPAVVLFYPRYHFAVSERVEGAEPEPLVSPGDRVRQIPKWYER